MSMLDDYLEFVELNARPERRKKARQWMGFDDSENFEGIRPRKQKHHKTDDYDDYEPQRDSKRDLRRERRAKLAIMEREY